MNKILIFSFIFQFFLCSCALSLYSSIESQISRSITPEQILSAGVRIASSDLSPKEKKELSLKLAKHSLSVFRLYIKYFADGKKVPNKTEIVDMINFLRDNADNFIKAGISKKETTELIIRLSTILAHLLLK